MNVFECLGCGDCCYGEGGIIVEEGEASRIARFLRISEREFLNSCCENRNQRIYIKSGPDGWCIFFDREEKCTIHPVKPARCALWPFFPEILRSRHAWEMAREGCPGISRECTFEEFVQAAEDFLC